MFFHSRRFLSSLAATNSAEDPEIKGLFTISPDYGKVNFALDGKALNQSKSTDFYYKETRPARPLSLGTLPLTKGKHRFTITVAGKNTASSGLSFGIDEIQLIPAGSGKK